MRSFADGIGQIVNEEDRGTQNPLVLLTMAVDDSTSMSRSLNNVAVMGGHNNMLNMLTASPRSPLYLVRTRYMHGGSLSEGYLPLSTAPRMASGNYPLVGGTPLFKSSLQTLMDVEQCALSYKNAGNDVRTLTMFLTDGWNREITDDCKTTVEQVREFLVQMIAEDQHIVAGVGVNHPEADFRQVFLDMGIPEEWILTIRTVEEIQGAFTSLSIVAGGISGTKEEAAETKMAGFNYSTQQDTVHD